MKTNLGCRWCRKCSPRGLAAGLVLLALAWPGCSKSPPDLAQTGPQPAAIPADETPAEVASPESSAEAPELEPKPIPVGRPATEPSVADLPASNSPSSPSPSAPPAEAVRSPHASAAETPVAPLPDDPVVKPEVALSEKHAATCRVREGEPFPELSLADLEGAVHSLEALRQGKPTVIVFWDDEHVFAREQFSRLQRELVAPFGPHGVQVIAVAVGVPAERVRALRDEFGIECPCLLDPQGEAFGQVASEYRPRTYVLAPQGQIIWFDLEYSQFTQRGVRNAILYLVSAAKREA